LTTIVLVDVDCHLDPNLVFDWAQAAQIFVSRDVAKPQPFGWGVDARIRIATSIGDIQSGEWGCCLWSQPDVPGALGYHDVTVHGRPLMSCFPLIDDIENGCVTITHEIVETLVDPLLSSASVGGDGVIRAREPGDPVEATSYEIEVSSKKKVRVTNFVLPAYFEPPTDLTDVPLDKLGLIRTPGEILPGGYQLVLDAGQWTSHQMGNKRAYRDMTSRVSRGNRRMSFPSKRSPR